MNIVLQVEYWCYANPNPLIHDPGSASVTGGEILSAPLPEYFYIMSGNGQPELVMQWTYLICLLFHSKICINSVGSQCICWSTPQTPAGGRWKQNYVQHYHIHYCTSQELCLLTYDFKREMASWKCWYKSVHALSHGSLTTLIRVAMQHIRLPVSTTVGASGESL